MKLYVSKNAFKIKFFNYILILENAAISRTFHLSLRF